MDDVEVTREPIASIPQLGVVYISPSTGGHYPAFIHVYRCETSRNAQKLLSRLRAYILVDSHHRRLVRVEQDLLARNLLNLDSFHASLSHSSESPLSNPGASSSSTVSSSNQDDSRQEKRFDPLKSITEEFQKKINANEPLLYPPKDYDTLHAAHGDVRRAQAWKSTEVTFSERRHPPSVPIVSIAIPSKVILPSSIAQ